MGRTALRYGGLLALHGIVPDRYVYWVAALIFGIPHFFGIPGGLIGAAMAAFLGWLLAKSVVETRGMVWAWFIHFLQDVVIFFGLFSTIS